VVAQRRGVGPQLDDVPSAVSASSENPSAGSGCARLRPEVATAAAWSATNAAAIPISTATASAFCATM
jgi:hypothetical protein